MKNLQKYNLIKYFVSHVFECLSIQEAKHNSEIFELLEEKIFYNLLHIEIELLKIRPSIIKEIKKSEQENESQKKKLADEIKNLDKESIFRPKQTEIKYTLCQRIMRALGKN